MTADPQVLAVRNAAERLAAVFAVDPDHPEVLGVTDEAVLEDLLVAAEAAQEALKTDDYDQFKYACALVVVSGHITGDNAKWRVADIAGDVVWTVNRQLLEKEMEKAVDTFLGEMFPE